MTRHDELQERQIFVVNLFAYFYPICPTWPSAHSASFCFANWQWCKGQPALEVAKHMRAAVLWDIPYSDIAYGAAVALAGIIALVSLAALALVLLSGLGDE